MSKALRTAFLWMQLVGLILASGLLVRVSAEGNVSCSDISNPSIYRVDGKLVDFIHSASLSPDGKQVAIAQISGVYVYDADTLQPISTLACPPPHNLLYPVAWSPDGSKIAIFDQDEGITIWDANKGNRLFSLRGEDDRGIFQEDGEDNPSIRVYDMVWSPDSRYIAAFGDIPLRVWDVQSQKVVFTNNVTTDFADYSLIYPGKLVWSSDGSQLFLARFQHILVWNTNDWQPANELDPPMPDSNSSIQSLSFSGSNELAWGGDSNYLQIWDSATKEYTLNYSNNPIAAYTVSWMKGTNKLALAVDPYNRIGYAEPLSTIDILDVSTGKVIQTLLGHTNTVVSLQWYPDGKRLLSLESQFSTSKLFEWDVETGKMIAELSIGD